MCVTYDAFGRIVETSNNLAWRTRWITQLGETANMNGTTINFAYWPEPGGGTVVITGNSGAFYHLHKDWLGNARVASTVKTHGIQLDQAYTPYGEKYDTFGSPSTYFDLFAGTTSNFDDGVMWDTPNRELSIVGRWLSPDPAHSGWNQYAYPTNPNSEVDSTGLTIQRFYNYQSEYDVAMEGYTSDWWNWDDPLQMFAFITSGLEFPISGPGYEPLPARFPVNRGPQLGWQGIFSGEDCPGCWSLGPSPIQILQAALSGNIWGALQDVGAVPLDGLDCTSGVCQVNPLMDANPANNGDTHPGLQIFYNNPNCPHCGDLWKQADCTFNGTLTDELGSLADTGATAAASGAATAGSAGTQVTKGVVKELGTTFTELFGILEYGKVMLKTGYRMIAGCQ